MPAIFVLTPQAIQQNLQNDGLTALGLTSLALSPRWGGGANATFQNYSDSDLTIDVANGDLRAPFRGTLEGVLAPASSSLSANITATATSMMLDDVTAFPAPP